MTTWTEEYKKVFSEMLKRFLPTMVLGAMFGMWMKGSAEHWLVTVIFIVVTFFFISLTAATGVYLLKRNR